LIFGVDISLHEPIAFDIMPINFAVAVEFHIISMCKSQALVYHCSIEC